MGKAPAAARDSEAGSLRAIPSVERVLSSPGVSELTARFGREQVKAAVNAHLADLRASRTPWDEKAAIRAIQAGASLATSSTLRPVINATGVIIHTNLGRAPIDPGLWAEAGGIASGYANLEFDLDQGARGKRDEHLTAVCTALFGCEAAVLTNNNAAGTLLALAAAAPRKEVVVSRGELVEIGGAFRVPDVIQQGGARLREVGTTNRTRASDYADAISRKTGALLRVHRSNFDIVGFTETPSVAELVDVARSKRVPMLYDEGSGRVVDLAPYGFEKTATIRELIAAGVDAVMCSTDKLIGATQGGLILGSEDIVSKCRSHPLMRALRAGKESYAVVGATLRAFATARHEELVPIYRMLATPIEALRQRAEDLIRGTACEIVESQCALGGGTTPTETIASIAIAVPGNATALHQRFLRMPTPIVGRIADERFTLETRTLSEADLKVVAAALRNA